LVLERLDGACANLVAMNAYTNFVEIGKGSFGTVYKADKKNREEQYAIKKVRVKL